MFILEYTDDHWRSFSAAIEWLMATSFCIMWHHGWPAQHTNPRETVVLFMPSLSKETSAAANVPLEATDLNFVLHLKVQSGVLQISPSHRSCPRIELKQIV